MSRKPARPADRALRSAARFYAVQALFQMEASGQTVEAIRREFLAHRIGADVETGASSGAAPGAEDEAPRGVAWVEADQAYFGRLVDLAVDQQGRIDQLTDRALVAKWPIARIDPTLRALFRAAGAEIAATDTPPRVVITEFVQIAQAFFPEGKESAFVNAVLDHMAREARPEAFAG